MVLSELNNVSYIYKYLYFEIYCIFHLVAYFQCNMYPKHFQTNSDIVNNKLNKESISPLVI